MLVLVFLLCSVSVAGGYQTRIAKQDIRIAALETENERLHDDLAATRQGHDIPDGELASQYSATVPILTYDRSKSRGRVVRATVTSFPGEEVYLRIDRVVYQPDTQISLITARSYVERVRGLDRRGVYIELDSPEDWDSVRGDSAGLAFVLAMLATDPSVSVDPTVAYTGGITPDGQVTPVYRTYDKAVAARDAGYEILLVPEGNAVVVDGIHIVEVETVDEAAGIALTGFSG